MFSGRAVAAGDGVHGERLPLSAQDYGGSRNGGLVPYGAGPGAASPEWAPAQERITSLQVGLPGLAPLPDV
jgi:hypothetical protein